ncbi:hypothetical protein DL93DRAFT_1808452 [Clavulina sp. PMI_390]|nr:hypothetical protein DL93DRAFT_1808452 [Clavulina sp. PMI_390]
MAMGFDDEKDLRIWIYDDDRSVREEETFMTYYYLPIYYYHAPKSYSDADASFPPPFPALIDYEEMNLRAAIHLFSCTPSPLLPLPLLCFVLHQRLLPLSLTSPHYVSHPSRPPCFVIPYTHPYIHHTLRIYIFRKKEQGPIIYILEFLPLLLHSLSEASNVLGTLYRGQGMYQTNQEPERSKQDVAESCASLVSGKKEEGKKDRSGTTFDDGRGSL